MSNEKRLIDANALTDAIESTDWYHISLQGNLAHGARSDIHTPLYKADDIYKALKDAPTVDAVEVVRCRDCKNWVKFESSLIGDVKCCTGQGSVNILKEPDDFCSYGERKDGDGNG